MSQTKKSLQSQVFNFFENNSDADNEFLYKFFKAKDKKTKNTLRRYKSRFLKKLSQKTSQETEKDKKGQISKISKNNDKKAPPLPIKDPGFFKFCKWFSIPAYDGLFQWQKEHHTLTWDAEYEMTLVPRDSGKSVEYTAKYQWSMQFQDFDVLLLGWTDRRKEIAMYVYTFFMIYDLIETDRRTSPFHFRLKNGGKFDCYLITSKETLGMHSEGAQERFSNMSEEDWIEFKSLFEEDHNEIDLERESDRIFEEDELKAYVESRKGSDRKLWISIDDPIDISFMKERHKEEILEMHFNSSLYGIHPAKWSFTGTRKFEDDIFDFFDKKFKKELVKYIRGTRNLDGSLLCPERFTVPELPTYKKDLKAGKRCLLTIREHVGEYAWYSEYEQNPHPITGEVWKSVKFEKMLADIVNRSYDLCFISIDRATTIKKTSDYTGCPIGLREKQTGNRIIIDDYSGHIPFDKLLILINDFVIEFRAKYRSPLIIIIVEKQGGGDDFITMAKNLREFIREDGTRVQNRIPELAAIIEVHSTGEKLGRIKERLYAPIKNEKIRFLRIMRNSELVKEILNFPHSAKLDAIDALANADFIILTEYPFISGGEGSIINKYTILLKHQKKADEFKNDQEKEKEETISIGAPVKKRYIFDEF